MKNSLTENSNQRIFIIGDTHASSVAKQPSSENSIFNSRALHKIDCADTFSSDKRGFSKYAGYQSFLPTILFFSNSDSIFAIKHQIISYLRKNKKPLPTQKELNTLSQNGLKHKKILL